MTGSEFAVLIPVYNAEKTIGEVIRRSLRRASHIIVVDDGSTDGSAGAAEQIPGVALLRHEVNQRKGAALQTGFRYAKEQGFAAVITLDADGQHHPDDIPNFLEGWRSGKGRILLGNRFATVRGKPPQMPWLRFFSNRLSSALISLLIGARLADIQCGYRLYETSVLEELTLHEKGFNFETEVVAAAVRSGIKVGSVPVRCIYDNETGISHYRYFSDSWEIAKAVVLSLWGGKR